MCRCSEQTLHDSHHVSAGELEAPHRPTRANLNCCLDSQACRPQIEQSLSVWSKADANWLHPNMHPRNGHDYQKNS